MSEDDDLAATLPDPPPPSPNAREEAIGEAMRRFDGEPASPSRPARPPSTGSSWIRRPQVGAFVTVGLIALVGLPAAWMMASHQNEAYQQASRGAALDISPASGSADSNSAEPGLPAAMASPNLAVAPHNAAPPMPVPAPQEAAAPPVAETVQAPQDAAPEVSAPAQLAKADTVAPEPAKPVERRMRGTSGYSNYAVAPAPPPPPPAMVMAAPPPPPPPPPAPVASAAPAPAMDSSEVVVTGARVSRARVGRGDWNACTVNDPSQNLSLCRKVINPAAPGIKGVAAAHVADGLTQAWQGDTSGAISAFDQAIAIAPTLPAAYLNRSLAYARSGDNDRALADADKAVRYAPYSAQAHYNRSQLLRRKGETAKAQMDEERAADIDPSYEAVIPQ